MAEVAETKLCKNCKREIAAANFLMHEVHCRRNLVVCETCGEPVPRTELDSHHEQEHADVTCDLCSASVEKAQIEQHKSSECPKRPVTCGYCELECVHSELAAHQDYCGSRTEPCKKCGQYIMHKDLIRHEDSNCSYPVVQKSSNKPSVPNNARAGASGSQGQNRQEALLPDQFYGSFAMDELSRILHNTDMLPPHARNPTRIKKAPSNADRAKASSRTTQPGSSSDNSKRLPKKKNNATSVVAEADKDAELDRLLAMQLAKDLKTPEVNSEEVDRLRDRDLEQLASVQDIDYSAYQDSSLEVPCEFCGEVVAIQFLYEHQLLCSRGEDPSGVEASDPLPARDERPVNRPAPGGPSNTEVPPWLAEYSDSAPVGMDDEVMLPCEFCHNLFPDDILIQHQAVCDVDRGRTPAPGGPLPKARLPKSRNTSGIVAAAPSSSRQRRRQSDPVSLQPDTLGSVNKLVGSSVSSGRIKPIAMAASHSKPASYGSAYTRPTATTGTYSSNSMLFPKTSNVAGAHKTSTRGAGVRGTRQKNVRAAENSEVGEERNPTQGGASERGDTEVGYRGRATFQPKPRKKPVKQNNSSEWMQEGSSAWRPLPREYQHNQFGRTAGGVARDQRSTEATPDISANNYTPSFQTGRTNQNVPPRGNQFNKKY